MKKHILSIALIACGITAEAQSFSMVDTARTTHGTTDDVSITNPVQIINNSGTNLNMSWNRFYEDMPAGWDVSSCSPAGCAPIGVSQDTYVLDTTNSLTDYHNCHFYPNGIAGTGEAKVRILNTDTQEEAIVTWYGIIGYTNVNEIAQGSISIYPNPGSEPSINYDFGSLDKVSMTVFSTEGKLILSENVNGIGNMHITGQAPGVYIVRFTSPEGLNLSERLVID